MTYRELLYKAQRLIKHNEITLGEYDEMTKPLDGEVRKVGKWLDCGHVDRGFRKYKCTNCSDFVYEKEYQIKHHKCCLHCGADMRGVENE